MTFNHAPGESRILASNLDASHVGARFAFDDTANQRHIYGQIEGIDVDGEGIWLFMRGKVAGDNEIGGSPLKLRPDATIHLLDD